jgi:hypothetical protein
MGCALMNSLCPLTHQKCVFVNFGGHPCSEHPNLEDASHCISQVAAMVVDREKEIEALDLLVEQYKSKPLILENAQ